MFGERDLVCLIDMAGVHRLTNGWRIVIRAEWADKTPQRPHGVSYAFILQDERGVRLLGLDNSHAFDGAESWEPFDHEHKPHRVGEHLRYDFTTPAQLIKDGFDRCEAFCCEQGVAFEVEDW